MLLLLGYRPPSGLASIHFLFPSEYNLEKFLSARPKVDPKLGLSDAQWLPQGRQLYIANVGDSRAIMAIRGAGGDLVAYDLTSDQTPFR